MSRFARLIGILFALLAVVAGAAWFQLQIFLDKPLNISGNGIEYSLERGSTLSAMAYALGRRGIITSPRWLTLYCRLTGHGRDIRAGDYWLQSGLTPRQLLQKLESGDVRYFEVTLVEGWTVAQVLQHLRAQPRLAVTLEGNTVTAAQLGVDWDRPMEGMFFPDTYRFPSGDSDVSILTRAFDRMQSVLGEEWQRRSVGLPYQNAYQALILASLVEKETGYAPERARIAGVFVRRLERNMRLQTDPAVIYGLGASFDGNLRVADLKDASNPYNTYRHRGLPPTPIALAGRESIHAALNPAQGTALYFVAKGDGSHHFSDTLAEHRRAVRKFQVDHRSRNYTSSPPPGA